MRRDGEIRRGEGQRGAAVGGRNKVQQRGRRPGRALVLGGEGAAALRAGRGLGLAGRRGAAAR